MPPFFVLRSISRPGTARFRLRCGCFSRLFMPLRWVLYAAALSRYDAALGLSAMRSKNA